MYSCFFHLARNSWRLDIILRVGSFFTTAYVLVSLNMASILFTYSVLSIATVMFPLSAFVKIMFGLLLINSFTLRAASSKPESMEDWRLGKSIYSLIIGKALSLTVA